MERLSNAANPLPLSVDEDDRERFERQKLASDSSIASAAIANNDRTRTINQPTSTDDVMIANTNRSLKPELNNPTHPSFTETLSEKAHNAKEAISHALNSAEDEARADAAYLKAKAKAEAPTYNDADRTRTINQPTSTDDVLIANTNRSLQPELAGPAHPSLTETLAAKAHNAKEAISHAFNRVEDEARADAAYLSSKAKEETTYLQGKLHQDAEYMKSEARTAEKSLERSLDRPVTNNTDTVGPSGSALPTSVDDAMMTSTDYSTTAAPIVDRSV